MSLGLRAGTLRALGLLVAGLMFVQGAAAQAQVDRARIEAFLEVTGFDVALESLKFSASGAPAMLGLEANDFGLQWTRLTEDVFDVETMHDLALQMLAPNLTTEMLDHANAFYGSELGQRLVEAENAAHMNEDDAVKSEAGEAIVDGLVRIGSDRVQELRRMTQAVDNAGASIRALQEIQVRFLMAAAAADVIQLQMEEPDLREALRAQEGELRLSIQKSSLSNAAYTYQAFSDEDVSAYADALENPIMQQVYELMNAVQYEVMANRFEALAARMASLQPTTDL